MKKGKSGANHGTVKESSSRGQTIQTPYGKDSPGPHGSAEHERGQSMGGSVTNVSHSLSSGKAKQNG
ncbi:MAG: hypothetical protein GY952_14165 [Rhodobacteraceae bacterium]|nr:hypothetical protein [Paracoccaceae bacterium]